MPDDPSALNRSANFIHRYANQLTFELNVSDLRIVFGTTEKNAPSTYHTAITVTWAEAKILKYLLAYNLALYEAFEGKVFIPFGMLPPPPTPPSEDKKDDTRAQEIHQTLLKLYSDLMAEQKADAEAPKG